MAIRVTYKFQFTVSHYVKNALCLCNGCANADTVFMLDSKKAALDGATNR